MGDRNRSRRRPPRANGSGYEGPTTEEEFPAAAEEVDTLDQGPIHQELARRGLQASAEGAEEEEWDEPAAADGDALVFDDEGTAEANGGETFVGELPLEDEVDPAAGAEKTEILSVADIAHDAYPVLTIEAADGATSEVDVVKDSFMLGRAPDSDVVIPDSLVSRHHAAIVKRDDGWYLVDQNSGNGTFLNDERIRDELLYDGDVVQVGDALITFTAPGGAADQAPRLDATQMLPAAEVMGAPASGGTSVTGTHTGSPAARKRKKLLIITAIVVVLLGTLAVVKLVVFKPVPKGPTKAQIMAQKRAKAETMARADFEKVKQLVKEEKWAEAKPMIADIASFLKDDKTVQEYRATIDKEAAAEAAISEASSLADQKKYEEAIAALSKMPTGSLQAGQAEKLKKNIDESRLELQLEQAGAALNEKRWDDALADADEILRAFPENEAATEIRHKAEEAKSTVRPPVHHKRRKKIHKPPPPPKAKFLLVGKALDLYRIEKVDDALSQASSAGVSADGVKTLRRFQSFYKQGIELSRNVGQSAKAIQFLTKALSLDKQLSGSKGQITSNLRKKLAKVYFLQGVDAHTRKKYPLAFASFTKAKKYNPGLEQAAKRLRDLEIEAKKLFETAYVIKGSSPEKAVSHCTTVMGMVVKSNIYYDKCKKLIAKIRGPLGSTSDGAGDGF